jgi:hypothetical protein
MRKLPPFFKPGQLPALLGAFALIAFGLCAARFGWLNGLTRFWVNHEIKTMREAGEKIAEQSKAQK